MSWPSIGPPAVDHSSPAPRLAACITAEGREALDFIPGEVRHDMPRWQRDESILADVARALREWHDATTSSEVRPDDVWFFPGREPREVICQNDFAPYNHVFRDHRFVGAIDYDICYPAPRLWDLAYTGYRYDPLTPRADADVDDGPGAGRSPHERVGSIGVRNSRRRQDVVGLDGLGSRCQMPTGRPSMRCLSNGRQAPLPAARERSGSLAHSASIHR